MQSLKKSVQEVEPLISKYEPYTINSAEKSMRYYSFPSPVAGRSPELPRFRVPRYGFNYIPQDSPNISSNTAEKLFPISPTGYLLTKYIAILNSVNVFIGIGIIALPYAFGFTGWLGVILLSLLGMVMSYTGVLIGKCQNKLQVDSYPDIVESAFGITAKVIVTVLFYVKLLFEVTTCMILLSMVISSLFQWKKIPCTLLSTVLFILVANFFIGSRGHSVLSIVASLSIVSLCTILIVGFILQSHQNRSSVSNLPALSDNAFAMGFQSVGIFCYCFDGHAVLPSIQRNLKHRSEFPEVVRTTFTTMTIIYWLIGVLGYWAFGTEAEMNVIQNISYGSAVYYLTAIIVGATVTTKFALISVPLTESLIDWITISYILFSRNRSASKGLSITSSSSQQPRKQSTIHEENNKIRQPAFYKPCDQTNPMDVTSSNEISRIDQIKLFRKLCSNLPTHPSAKDLAQIDSRLVHNGKEGAASININPALNFIEWSNSSNRSIDDTICSDSNRSLSNHLPFLTINTRLVSSDESDVQKPDTGISNPLSGGCSSDGNHGESYEDILEVFELQVRKRTLSTSEGMAMLEFSTLSQCSKFPSTTNLLPTIPVPFDLFGSELCNPINELLTVNEDVQSSDSSVPSYFFAVSNSDDSNQRLSSLSVDEYNLGTSSSSSQPPFSKISDRLNSTISSSISNNDLDIDKEAPSPNHASRKFSVGEKTIVEHFDLEDTSSVESPEEYSHNGTRKCRVDSQETRPIFEKQNPVLQLKQPTDDQRNLMAHDIGLVGTISSNIMDTLRIGVRSRSDSQQQSPFNFKQSSIQRQIIHILIRTFLPLIAFTLSIKFSDYIYIISFLGGIFGTLISIIIPSFCFIKIFEGEINLLNWMVLFCINLMAIIILIQSITILVIR